MLSNFRSIKADILAASESDDIRPLWASVAWITAAIVTTVLWLLACLSVTAVILWVSWIVDIVRGA